MCGKVGESGLMGRVLPTVSSTSAVDIFGGTTETSKIASRRISSNVFHIDHGPSARVLMPYHLTPAVKAFVCGNSSVLLNKVAKLYSEKTLCDICLVVGGVEFPCHRLVLSASSDVFQVMLTNPHWNESNLNKVELVELPESLEVFDNFLRYFYTGKIQLSLRSVMPILLLADKYNVIDMVALCLNYMLAHIAHAATSGYLVSWLQYAHYYGHNVLSQTCMDFLKWNLQLIMETSGLSCLDADLFGYLLQQSNLVVYNEMTLYRYAEDWINSQRDQLGSNEKVESLVKQVMTHIRFPMLSPRQLAELLLSPLTKEYKDFFVERMAIGMSFHHGKIDKALEELDGGLTQITPRLYTANDYGSLLTVEKYRSLPSYTTNTFVFSSHTGLADHEGDIACEWVVDVYPKGVRYENCYMILWDGKMGVPGVVYKTVRLSITCKDPPSTPADVHIKVGIILYGWQNGIECVRLVREGRYHFSETNRVLLFDDLLPFDELNPPAGTSLSSKFLLGPSDDMLKMHVVIEPLPSIQP